MSVVEDSGSTVVLDSLAAFLRLWRLAVHSMQANFTSDYIYYTDLTKLKSGALDCNN